MERYEDAYRLCYVRAGARPRYNALVARVVSFARAAERAGAG